MQSQHWKIHHLLFALKMQEEYNEMMWGVYKMATGSLLDAHHFVAIHHMLDCCNERNSLDDIALPLHHLCGQKKVTA